MCALRKAAMCLCTWQLFLAQAEQLPGALLHHAARPACLLGTRVTTTIPPNCPGTNTLPRALLADIALPVGCESAQTARNPREADSSNAFDSDLGSWTVAHARRLRVRLAGSQYLVSSRSGTTVPKELDTIRQARDAIFLTGCKPSTKDSEAVKEAVGGSG